MKKNNPVRYQYGFGIIAAVFILVIVSLVIASMSSISQKSHTQVVLNLQRQQAYYAANSGLNYIIARVLASSANCVASTEVMQGFNVALTCSATAFDDGAGTVHIYRVSATATKGSMANNTFIKRSIEADITDF